MSNSSGRGHRHRRQSNSWRRNAEEPDAFLPSGPPQILSDQGSDRRRTIGKGGSRSHLSPTAPFPPMTPGARGAVYVPPKGSARSVGASSHQASQPSMVPSSWSHMGTTGSTAAATAAAGAPVPAPRNEPGAQEVKSSIDPDVSMASPRDDHVADDGAQSKSAGDVPPSADPATSSPVQDASLASAIAIAVEAAMKKAAEVAEIRERSVELERQQKEESFRMEMASIRVAAEAQIDEMQAQLDESMEAAAEGIAANARKDRGSAGHYQRPPSIPASFCKYVKEHNFDRTADFTEQFETLLRDGLMGAPQVFSDLLERKGYPEVISRAEEYGRDVPYTQAYVDEVDASMAKVLAEWPSCDDLSKTLRAAIVELKSIDGTFAVYRIMALVRESSRSQNSNLVLMRRRKEFSSLVFRGSADLAKESIVGHMDHVRQSARTLTAGAGFEVISQSEADLKWLENVGMYPKPISGAEKSLWDAYDDVLICVRENMDQAFRNERILDDELKIEMPYPECMDPMYVFAEIRKVDADRLSSVSEAKRAAGKVEKSGEKGAGGSSNLAKAQQHPHFAVRVGNRKKPATLKKLYKVLAAEVKAGKPLLEAPVESGVPKVAQPVDGSTAQINAFWAGNGSGNGGGGGSRPAVAFSSGSCGVCGATDHGTHAGGKMMSYSECRAEGKCPCMAIGVSPYESASLPLGGKDNRYPPCWWCGKYGHSARICCRQAEHNWCKRISPYASSPAGQKHISEYIAKVKAEREAGGAGANVAEVPNASAFAVKIQGAAPAGVAPADASGQSVAAPAAVPIVPRVSFEAAAALESYGKCSGCEVELASREPCFPKKRADGKMLGMLCLGCNISSGQAQKLGGLVAGCSSVWLYWAEMFAAVPEFFWIHLLLLVMLFASFGALAWVLSRCFSLLKGKPVEPPQLPRNPLLVPSDMKDAAMRAVEVPAAPQGEKRMSRLPAKGPYSYASDEDGGEIVHDGYADVEYEDAVERSRKQAKVEQARRVKARVEAHKFEESGFVADQARKEEIRIRSAEAAAAVRSINAKVRRNEKRALQRLAVGGGSKRFCAYCGELADRACGQCQVNLDRCCACNDGSAQKSHCVPCLLKAAGLAPSDEIRVGAVDIQEKVVGVLPRPVRSDAPQPARHQLAELAPQVWYVSPPARPIGVPCRCPKDKEVKFGIADPGAKNPGCAYWRCAHGASCYFKWQPAPRN